MTDRSIGIYFLDVGQGDASLIMPPLGEGDPILMDCRDAFVVKQTLRAWGCRRLEAVVISHLDFDHIRDALDLISSGELEIGALYLPVDRDLSDSTSGTQSARALMDEAREGVEAGLWETYPSERLPSPIASGDGWSVSLIAPRHADATLAPHRTGRWGDANAYSAILRVQFGDGAVLIGGDATLASWAALSEDELRADVIRVPHHGGTIDRDAPEGWDTARLYQSVRAGTAAISVGSNNGHDHPIPEQLGSLPGSACRLMCTQLTERCQSGTKARGRQLKQSLLSSFSSMSSPYAEPLWRHYEVPATHSKRRNDEVPCAGTIVVDLLEDGSTQLYPVLEQHTPIIDQWGDPLCRPLDSLGD